MKKLAYILYLIICKPLGRFWIFFVLPFRGYARNVVYNYVLQNDLPLKRLRERSPKWVGSAVTPIMFWSLEDIHGLSSYPQKLRGFIKFRRVNKLQFYLVVFLIWGWLDDDSNQDTTDTGYIRTLITGERKSWHSIFNRWLVKIDLDKVVYGNAFDLGDVRAQYPFFNWAATWCWTDRNSAMNFEYLFFGY